MNMAVGLQKFAIVLDNSDSTFSPGEVITGRVVVELGRPKSIRGLKIRFKGSGEVKWSESTGTGKDRRTEWDVRTEVYFRNEFYLLGGVGNAGNVEIQIGCHVFPFSFSLPHNIPSSFQHTYGSIRYAIKAVLDRPWKFDHQTSIVFTVETPYDLSLNPATRLGIEDEEHDTFCCFSCFNMGSMTLNISVPVSGFAIGEAIEATFAINNNSTSVEVTGIRLQLKQKLKFHGNKSTKSESNFVQKAEKKGPFNKRDEIVVGMQVPAVPPSTFPHSQLIDIDYKLVVGVAVSGCHCDTDRSYPIVIGSNSSASCQTMSNTIAYPASAQNSILLPTVQPNVPSAPFLAPEYPTSNTVPFPVPGGQSFPESSWSDTSGPAPYPPNPPYGFTPASQPYPSPLSNCSTRQPFNYPPGTGSPLGFVSPIPGTPVTSTTEKPPPSYDDCTKMETKQ